MDIENDDAAPLTESTIAEEAADVDPTESSAIARQLEADPARLERLRQAVRSGRYSVPATEVSARLIDEHLADSEIDKAS